MLCGVRTVGGRRVLVVDGERAQAQRTAAGLRACGFEPIVLGKPAGDERLIASVLGEPVSRSVGAARRVRG
jgi:hypothetical protein